MGQEGPTKRVAGLGTWRLPAAGQEVPFCPHVEPRLSWQCFWGGDPLEEVRQLLVPDPCSGVATVEALHSRDTYEDTGVLEAS